MDTSWWIYMEEDERQPGWQLWRVHGILKKTPPHGDECSDYVLATRGESSRVWMRKSQGEELPCLHHVELGAKAGCRKKRDALTIGDLRDVQGLVKPLDGAWGSQWVEGHSALREDIDALLGREADACQQVALRAERARKAPLLWGADLAEPNAGWSGSMHKWQERFREWSTDAASGSGAMEQWRGLRLARAKFLQDLAMGSASPAQSWSAACSSMPQGLARVQGLDLARQMERMEIDSGARAGCASIKACRI
jgi:hypothetical protein